MDVVVLKHFPFRDKKGRDRMHPDYDPKSLQVRLFKFGRVGLWENV